MKNTRSPLVRTLILAMAGTAMAACGGEAPAADARMAGESRVASASDDLGVYKSPTCGCCGGWIEHMEQAGYTVDARDVDYAELARQKGEHGIPADLGSCHTGSVGGYSLEGHIPAYVIDRLLEERPDDIRGLAVPGMPAGSPGMESPTPEAYDVIAIRKDGSRVVYESVYPGKPSSDAR